MGAGRPRAQERGDAARRARSVGRARAVRSGAPREGSTPGSKRVAREPRAEGQAAAGHDDRRAEGAVRTRGDRRAGQRLHRRRRRRRRARRRDRGHSRSRPIAAAALRRVGIGVARGRRDAADDRRAARHRRSVPGRRRPDRSAPTARSRSSSASRAAAIRCRACAGPPAVLGWATGHLHEPPNNPQLGMANMRTLMPALQKAKPAAVADGRRVRERGRAVAAARDARREGLVA